MIPLLSDSSQASKRIRAIDVISMKKALFSPRPSTAKSVLERRRRRVISLVESLPEASAVVAGETHLSLEVRGKRFGYFLDDHHGDGRVALNCKTAPGVNETLACCFGTLLHSQIRRGTWVARPLA
jgi:hypothetical protein